MTSLRAAVGAELQDKITRLTVTARLLGANPLLGVAAADKALAGQEVGVTAPGLSGLALRMMVPLARAGEQTPPHAVLAAGIRLDDRTAKGIGDDIQARVAVLSPQGEVACRVDAARRGGAVARAALRRPEPARKTQGPEEHERCRAAGMDGVLLKPFTRAELTAALARVVHAVPVQV